MITHAVLFRLAEQHRAEADQLAAELVNALSTLPSVVGVRGGRDVLGLASSCDLAVIVTVRNDLDLQHYLRDPAHLAAARELIEASDAIVTATLDDASR